MSLAGKRVLITGAGGFIGSHLAERIVQEGGQCRAMVHYNALGRRGWLDHSSLTGQMEIVAGDIADSDSVDEAVEGCDLVLHLAALIPIPYSYRAPRSFVRTNIEGTLNILQACRRHDVARLVHTSTSEVYGTAQFVPISEAHPLSAQSPYAASKVGADQMVLSFVRSFNLPAIILRPFNTFGPRQSVRAVIPSIILQILDGNVIQLGKASTLRDFNFVQNTVDGFLAAGTIEGRVGETFNIGTNVEVSIDEVSRRIGAIFNVVPKIECDDRRLRPADSEVERLCADVTLAREKLGWRPRIPLDEGLRLTAEWFRANRSLYSTDTFAL